MKMERESGHGLKSLRGPGLCPSPHSLRFLQQTGTAERDLSQPHVLPGMVKQTGAAPGLLPACVAERELQDPEPLGCPCWEGRKVPSSTGGAGHAKVDTALSPCGMSMMPVFKERLLCESLEFPERKKPQGQKAKFPKSWQDKNPSKMKKEMSGILGQVCL